MIKSDKSISWNVDLPLERSDEQYVGRYFENRTVMSRERKRAKDRYPLMLSDAAAAMVAYVQDDEFQKRMYQLADDLESKYTQEYREKNGLGPRELIPDIVRREIKARISDMLIAECHVWFSRFWSITQRVTLIFDDLDQEVINE